MSMWYHQFIWHISSGNEVTIVVCLVSCWVVIRGVFGPGWTKQKTLVQ
jgi:hypothetical protein